MRFSIAHLLWFTACCGLAAWLMSQPLATHTLHYDSLKIIDWSTRTLKASLPVEKTRYPVGEPVIRGVVWTGIFIAGILWLNRKCGV
jgi:hypothetical protein